MQNSLADRVFFWTRRIEEWLISASILVIAALTVANVACRTLLGFSVASAEEVSQFLMIVITFVGLSYAASQGRHIRMTALYDQLPQPARKGLMILVAASTCLLMLVFAWYSARYVAVVDWLGTASPVLQVPFAAVYAIVPVGFLLAAVQYGLTVLKNLRAPEVYIAYDHTDDYEPPATGHA